MKYIECMGIPGSGKTTVANDAVSILEPRYHPILTRRDAKPKLLLAMLQKKSASLWRLFSWSISWRNSPLSNFLWLIFRYRFILRFIRDNADLIPQVIENANGFPASPEIPHQFLSSEQLISWFFEVAGIYQAARDILKPDEILLLEEGFCQQTYYLITAFREHNERAQFLEQYVKSIPMPDLVIALSADPERCEQRLQTRGTGIPSKVLQSLAPTERIALFEQRQKTYQEVARYLEEHDVPVIRLDNNHNEYSATRTLLEQALERFSI
jgi:thymidylate kinase